MKFVKKLIHPACAAVFLLTCAWGVTINAMQPSHDPYAVYRQFQFQQQQQALAHYYAMAATQPQMPYPPFPSSYGMPGMLPVPASSAAATAPAQPVYPMYPYFFPPMLIPAPATPVPHAQDQSLAASAAPVPAQPQPLSFGSPSSSSSSTSVMSILKKRGCELGINVTDNSPDAVETPAAPVAVETSAPMNIDQTDQADAAPASSSSSSSSSSSGLSFEGIAQQPLEPAKSKRTIRTAKRTKMGELIQQAQAKQQMAAEVREYRTKGIGLDLDTLSHPETNKPGHDSVHTAWPSSSSFNMLARMAVQESAEKPEDVMDVESNNKPVLVKKRKFDLQNLSDKAFVKRQRMSATYTRCFKPTTKKIEGLGDGITLACKEPGCTYKTDPVEPTAEQLETAFTHYVNHKTKNHEGTRQLFQCGNCEVITDRAQKLLNHLRGCYNTNPFKCKYCNYRTNLCYTVDRHMKTCRKKPAWDT